MESSLWSGAIDNIGGWTLDYLLRSTHPWGSVASIGLALSPELNTNVMPFILRGVSLLGISSSNTPRNLREKIWKNLSSDLLFDYSKQLKINTCSLEEIEAICQSMVEGKTSGRTLVKIT